MQNIASARVLTPDGLTHDLFAGDVIGRVWHAALQVLDPRVSEFHAAISLRGGQLVLLPLRGTLRLDGVAVKTVKLERGLDVELVPGFSVRIISLHIPRLLPALSVDGGEPHLLERTASSVVDGDVLPGLHDAAVARVWTDGEQWYVETGGVSVTAGPGWNGDAGPHRLAFHLVPARDASVVETVGRPLLAPLHLVVRYDTVQLHPGTGDVTTLTGQPARLLSELAQLGGSAHWEVVAREIWRSQPDRSALRVRWDKTLRSLRRKLEAAHLPSDLVRSSGGYCELVLRVHDSLDVEV